MRRIFSPLLCLSLFAAPACALERPEEAFAVASGRTDGSNLPPPHSWKGSMRDFEPAVWRHGIWRHALHNRRLGWWWDVGMDHFAFDEPVFPHPDMLVPAGQPAGWWYWCGEKQEYFPYVTQCPAPWTSVTPRLLPAGLGAREQHA